jgi:4-amino-4-deoxy-L-arabinose transferase-like glycosyltransferase
MPSASPAPLWRRLAPPLVVVLLALTARVTFQRGAEAYPRLEYIRNALDDQVLYDFWAKSILAGREMDWAATGHEFAYWAARWPGVFPQDPLYPYGLAAFYRVFGFAYDGVRALQAALGAATALMVWALARRHVGPEAAFACGLLAALYQPLVFYEATLLREPLATFLLTGALLAVSAAASAQGRARPVAFAALAGTLLGIAVVTRSHLALPAAALGGWLFAATRRRLGMAPAACLAAGLALPVAPAVTANVLRSGHLAFVSSAGPYNLFIGNVRDAQGAASPTYLALKAQGPPAAVDLLAALRDDIAAHPLAFARGLAAKAALLLGTEEAPDNLSTAMGRRLDPGLRLAVVTDAALMPLALLGAALGLSRWRRHGLLYAFVVSYAASVVPFIVVSRLRQPLLPALAVFAGLALQQAADWLAGGRRIRAAAVAVAALLLALLLRPPRVSHRLVDFQMAAAAYEALGETRERSGDAAGAFRAYGRAAALNPDHGRAVSGALRAKAALGAAPPDTEAVALCAEAREEAERGRYPQALRLLERAAERAPGWALPHVYRVNVNVLRGREAAALDDLERAVALDPADARQRENLKALRRRLGEVR